MKKNLRILQRVLTATLLLLFNSQITYAQFFYSTGATNNLQQKQIHILITEVNFKNETHDFFKLTGWQENSDETINLEGLSIFVDNKLYEFTEKTYLSPYNELSFEFNNDIANKSTSLIKITNTGLTATTENITIKDITGKIWDTVCWENTKPSQSELKEIDNLIKNSAWKGPCFNSETVNKNESIKRKNFFQDTNTATDWEVIKNQTEKPSITTNTTKNKQAAKSTPQAATANPKEVTATNHPETNTHQSPTITEIFPNPSGSDTNKEWIELYNPHSTEINLNGWTIVTYSTKKISLPNTPLPPHSYYVIDQGYKFSLKNSNENIKLIDPSGKIIEEITYDKAPENQSFSKTENEWYWTEKPTPLDDNEVITETSNSNSTNHDTPSDIEANFAGQLSNQIYITEILANPTGTDTGKEWIELYNSSNEDVNIQNWIISNSTKENRISDSLVITAQSYLVLNNDSLGLSLKNSKEQISILDFSGTIIDLVEYDTSKEGLSYSLITNEDTQENLWTWMSPTPGEENLHIKNIGGEIKSFDAVNSLLEVKNTPSGDSIFVKVDEKNDIDQLAFIPGDTIKITAFEDKDHQYHLHEIKELAKTNTAEETSNYSTKTNSRIQGIIYFISFIIAVVLCIKIYEKLLPKIQLLLYRKKFHTKYIKLTTKV